MASLFSLPLLPTFNDVFTISRYKKSTRRLDGKEMFLIKLNKTAYTIPELRTNVDNLDYIGMLSNVDVAVYKLPLNKIIYMIWKGTSNTENVLTDLKLIKNIQDRTFRRALDQFDMVNKMFPDFKIIVSGHSLGGSKAMFVANKRNVEGLVINPFTPTTNGTMYNISKNTPQVKKIVNRDDLLSNKQLVINPPGLIVMVLKSNERGFLANHSINTLRFPDKYDY